MAELNVSKKNVFELLRAMQSRKFVIPEYQRTYQWDKEQCETLWNDIVDFTENSKDENYFLGTIVYAKDGNNLEVVDGQQRLTSLFLLLRGIYFKLDNMCSNNSDEQDDINGLKSQIAPCIWDTDEFSGKVKDKTKIHINSLIALSNENDIFHKILETGIVDDSFNDNYSLNYKFFEERNNAYAQNSPLMWKNLCLSILKKCIILPIECEDVDMALTIFSTLNDRGLPLADADIFKAQIYKALPVEERKEFTDKWKNLDEITQQASLTVDEIFRYYTHVLRAEEQDKSKEIGLRKFYMQKKSQALNDKKIIDNITDIAYFWREVITGKQQDGQLYVISIEAQKYLQCLKYYPNEFWKYAVTTFFYINKDGGNFEKEFEAFVKKLTAYLVAKFIEYPTVNKIKDDIYTICNSIVHPNSEKIKSDEKDVDLEQGYFIKDETQFKNILSGFNSSKITKCLLLLHAYQNEDQKNLIKNFEIEHIFPKKWQSSNYNGWCEADAQKYLEKLGNKIVFEKKLNIQAGNGYFGQKQKKYSQSKIASVTKLSSLAQSDWMKSDIEKREHEVISSLFKFFNFNKVAGI